VYEKEVEIVVSVKVESEQPLNVIDAKAVGEAVMDLIKEEGDGLNLFYDRGMKVTANLIPTKSDRPWSQTISYLAKARAAVGLAWGVVVSRD
jgi:putative component of toxin-antitoxin plasmid stabilization module